MHNSRRYGSNRGIANSGMLLLFMLNITLAAQVNGQGGRITFSLEDTTVETILEQVRLQADINFVYNHEALEACPRVNLTVRNATVEQVLEQCAKQANISYKKLNNTYVITPLEDKESLTVLQAETRKGVLKGMVIDADSRKPLPYASIVVETTDPMRGGTTDGKGHFRLERLPVGRHSLKVSYVGYREIRLPEIFVGSSKETSVIIPIEETTEAIGEVAVDYTRGAPLNQMVTVSARSFSVEETRRYAASISDPARMAQVFAGVAGTDDATNEIVIRGNSPNWLLWRLEGVEIPSPNHFAEEGYTAGAVSILSSDMLTTSDFLTGAFPAEFGNALSGVFDLRMRNGNSTKHEFSAQAGVLGFDFSAEGPFSKEYQGSYLLNYRYSTLSLLSLVNVEVSENALPNYQDLSFKLNLPAGKAGTFALWGIGGRSDDNELYIPDLDAGEDPEHGYRDYTRAGMHAVGVTHIFLPDDQSYIKTVLSQSNNFSGETYQDMDSTGILRSSLEDDLNTHAIRLTSSYNRKVSASFSMRFGMTMNHLDFRYDSRLANESGSLRTFLNGSGNTQLLQSYVQTKIRFSENLFATAGMHYSWFELSNDHSVEPRAGLQLKLPNEQKLSLGYGRHSKHEKLPVYFVEFTDKEGNPYYPNNDLKMTRSDHYIAGYEKMISPDLMLRAEAYFQWIGNLPVPNNPDKILSPIFGTVYPNDTLVNEGSAKNYGLEITLQKFFTNSYYLLFTHSLFEAKYRPLDGRWYNSKYNLNYITNLVGGKEFRWGTDKLFGIDAKIIWTGGKRQIPLDLDASREAGRAIFDFESVYETQAPDYFRIDLGLNFHLFKKQSEHIISLDVQNLTNRRNYFAEDYNPYLEDITYYRLSGIIPLLNYRIEF